MVSLWPWKGEDNSPASFEKALSALAAKISKSQTQLDSLRSSGRRLKALWTLYSIFAYILCFIILFLVVGWQNWGAVEYTAIAGSPVLIYVIRTAISTYYTYRIDTVTQRLEDQQASRAATIDKLKAATKYNSTQELLEKYGGAPPKPKKENKPPSKGPKGQQKPQQPERVGTGPPPPTANIQRPGQVPSQPSTPQPQPQVVPNRSPPSQYFAPPSGSPQQQPGPPEFAPNAFSAPPQYAQGGEMNFGGHWYDRVLDLLMGEDETLPKNRMALICQSCRLVNGQAPPGTKSPADLGKWRCFSCGAWNGEEDEATKAIQEMKEMIETQEEEQTVSEGAGKAADTMTARESGDGKDSEPEEEPEEADGKDSAEDTIEVKPKRGRPKGSRKRA